MLPARVLRTAGFTAAEVDLITAEVATYPWHHLEREEYWAEVIAATWCAKTRRPDVGGGYLRVRVRGALRDATRAELRAQGRLDRTFYWPWYRPAGQARYCEDCRTAIGPKRRLCASCAADRETDLIRRRQLRAVA